MAGELGERSPAEEPVRVVPYDPGWPLLFERERPALQEAIGEWVVGGIHHVGSTAIVGLEAKPVVDILVGVRDLDGSRACFGPLAALGYVYAPYRTTEMHWFCKPNRLRRTHHLHLVPRSSRRFRDELAFRDHLREHPQTARCYGQLKRELAQRFMFDREAYTEAKAEFVERVLRQARSEVNQG